MQVLIVWLFSEPNSQAFTVELMHYQSRRRFKTFWYTIEAALPSASHSVKWNENLQQWIQIFHSHQRYTDVNLYLVKGEDKIVSVLN